MTYSRRQFLGTSLALGVSAMAAGRAAAYDHIAIPGGAWGMSGPVPAGLDTPASALPQGPYAPPSQDALLAVARRELERNRDRILLTDRVAIADYAAHSTRPRFHIVDMQAGSISSFLVTHGRGSDPAHIGWVQQFSNQPGSLASSQGAYVTDSLYEGRYGTSLRLNGLDATNDRAMERAIVIHSAWYAEPRMITMQGKLGRSEGCFAFPAIALPVILDRLGSGRLLFADNL